MRATMVIKDASVVTMEEGESSTMAEAVAVRGDKIVAVGRNEDMEPLVGPKTVILRVPGRTVLPGFIDTHVHFTQTGLSALGPSVLDVTPAEAALDVVADAVADAGKGQPILIHGYSAGEMDRQLTRDELDQVAPQNPVMMAEVGGHACLVNTQAWQMLNLDTEAKGIQYSSAGDPSGQLLAEANNLARYSFYNAAVDDDTRVAAFHRAAQMALRKGITTVHTLEGGSQGPHGEMPQRDVEVLLQERGKLPVRTVVYFQSTEVQKALRWGLPRIGGCLCVDGAYGEHTAALLEPYADDPSTKGRLYFSEDELNAFVERAHREGLQVSMHAIGDRAIEQLLNAYERVLRIYPRPDHRHRIDHFSLPTKEQIERAARLGVAAAMQPNFALMPETGEEDEYQAPSIEFLGLERYKRRHPYRKIVDAGILVAGGSDSDAKPMGPLLAMHAVVNHPDEVRRLSVFEALTLYTINGAKIAFQEEEKGTIEVGKLADLVVLGDNPLSAEPGTLKHIPVEMTIVGGDIVYDGRSSQAT